jgi:hypothetical protein
MGLMMLWLRMQILPDLTESRWLYNGSTLLQEGRHANKRAESWVWRVTNDEGYGEYHNTYTFYVDKVAHFISVFPDI